jgi:gluconolactonase
MTHTTLRPEFDDLIDADAPVGQLGAGFTFTEGPIWHPVDHYLLFSDMPADVRRRWDAKRGVVEARRPANKCNGMTYDADLNLIVCEHATSSLVRERPEGRREVLAAHFDGRELNSPNDVCVRSDGSIYFSDPWYGRMPVYGVERPRQLGFQGVYRLPPSGGGPQLLVERDLFEQPNGLCFSPDERLLYVNDTAKALIRVFDVAADGSVADSQIFATGIRSELEPGLPDGMKCDARGNVWVTAPGGVWVYAPSGDLIGKVRAPELLDHLKAYADGREARAGGDAFRLRRRDESRSEARTLYERDRSCDVFGRRRRPADVAAGRGRRPEARSAALRVDHPGSAE